MNKVLKEYEIITKTNNDRYTYLIRAISGKAAVYRLIMKSSDYSIIANHPYEDETDNMTIKVRLLK